MDLKSPHFLVSLFILVLLSYAVFEVYSPPSDDLTLGPSESPEWNAQYFSDNESLVITLENGSLSRRSGVVAITNESGLVNHNDSIQSEFVLSYENRTEKTKFWATKSLFSTGIGNKGISDFPIEEGESITVVSDSTDTDGDGIKGIENCEEVILYSKDSDNYVPIIHFTIENDTANELLDLLSSRTEELTRKGELNGSMTPEEANNIIHEPLC